MSDPVNGENPKSSSASKAELCSKSWHLIDACASALLQALSVSSAAAFVSWSEMKP
jgi:hypothetical protein